MANVGKSDVAQAIFYKKRVWEKNERQKPG